MNAKVNELQVLEQNMIVAAFFKVGGTDELFERIAQEARSHVPDVTTKKGRDAIGSLAAKISSSKVIIEKYGKELVAEQKAQIKLIDDDRIAIVKKFDALRNEILAPRDAWEQAEKDRVTNHQQSIADIRAFGLTEGFTAQNISTSIHNLDAYVVDSSFEEFEQEAKIAKFETLEKLRTALAAREEYEAQQAELERLRQAEIERQQRERDEAIARQAAEAARIEAEKKAQAEREQAERAAIESLEREARLNAEKEAALLREQQLKQQAIEREKRAEIERQQAIEAERQRIEAEQTAKAKADQEAEAARLANVEHIRSINYEILKKFLEFGIEPEQAKAIITAIAKGKVPNVSIKY